MEPCWDVNTLTSQIVGQLWKTFLERTSLPRGIPDEVSDSERGELLPAFQAVSPLTVPPDSFFQMRLPISESLRVGELHILRHAC